MPPRFLLFARTPFRAACTICGASARLLSAFLTLCCLLGATHPVHISVTDGAYNPTQQRLELAVRLYTDDFEEAIKQQTGIRYHLGTADTLPGTEAAIARYLAQHLAFQNAQGQSLPPQWVGFEGDLKATWCYIVVPGLPSPEGLRVTNRLHFNLFEDQTNLMHLAYQGDTRSARTTNSQPTATFSWR